MQLLSGILYLFLLCSSIIFFSSLALSHLKKKEDTIEKPCDFYTFLFKGYYE